MTVPEIELLRQVNAHLRPVLTWESYNALVRMGGLAHLIGTRSVPAEEQRLALPTWADEAAQEYGQRAARRIRRSEVAVIGSLRRLREPAAVSDEPLDVEVVPGDVVAGIATGMITAAVARARRLADADMSPRDPADVVRRSMSGAGRPLMASAARALADLAVDLDTELTRVVPS